MKKIISGILVCFMLFSMVVPAMADDFQTEPTITFYSKNIKTNPSEDFMFEVNIKDNPGISNFFVILEYDNNLLDLTSESEGGRCSFSPEFSGSSFANENYDTNQACALFAAGDNIPGDKTLFKFRFTAKQTNADTKIKVILKEVGHFEETYELYDCYDLFNYSAPSYEADVSIGTNTELKEESSVSLTYMDDKKFADQYEEMMEARNTPKPTPKWIGADPSPSPSAPASDKPDDNKGDDSKGGDTELEKAVAVLNENVSAYMPLVKDNLFEPDRYATRYEIVLALSKIFTVKNAVDTDDFTDVSPEYKKIVNDFAQTGIISGYGETNNEKQRLFKGDLNITRAEFVKLMTDAFSIKASDKEAAGFSDIENHWAKDYITAFASVNAVSGYPDGTFKPDNNITRSEAVSVINRLLKIEPLDSSALQNPPKTFDDLNSTHWAYSIIMASFK